jgi:hypothetical protein
LCQAENGFSYAAIEEGSPGNPDSPTTYCAAHEIAASSAVPTRVLNIEVMTAQRKEKSFLK